MLLFNSNVFKETDNGAVSTTVALGVLKYPPLSATPPLS